MLGKEEQYEPSLQSTRREIAWQQWVTLINRILCTVNEEQNYTAIWELSAPFSVLCHSAGASFSPE